MIRPALACAALVTAGLTALPAAAGASQTAPPAGKPAPSASGIASSASRAVGRPSWQQAHGEHPADRAARDTHTPAPAANAKLDPDVLTQTAAADGTVRVSLSGARSAVAAKVRAQGGRVLAATSSATVAVVPRSHVRALAAVPAVHRVDTVEQPVRADVPAPGPSQAVAASNADDWQNATPAIKGSGVTIAIIDSGFGATEQQYDDEVAAGHLDSGTTLVEEDCVDANNVSTPYTDEHGLAVAEIAQQQAPAAHLVLYCVDTPEGLTTAEQAAETAGARIISSSLGWYGDARGDGTGAVGSVAAAAQKARKAGILWVNSAGNEVPQHYSGALADANGDGFLDLGNATQNTFPYESNFFTVAGGSTSAPSDFAFIFRWDNWPTTTRQLTMLAYGVQCTAAFGSGGVDDCRGSDLGELSQQSASGSQPVVSIDLAEDGAPNTSQFDQIWQVQIGFDTSFTKGAHFDLYGSGEADGASALSCPAADSDNNCIFSAAARNGSLLSPADSPYVLAVGAADVGADGENPGTLEYFSSRGPTIDGRTKPDITGWDGLSSYVYPDGFYGTSSAAPAVAGAAALVVSANSALDAAQVQNLLQQRASHPSGASYAAGAYNPPNPAYGYGLQTLGTPPATPNDLVTPGSRYTPVTPTRLLDTRSTVGNHEGRVGAGKAVTLTVPGLPADATAVAINLTGVGATGSTYLSAYPGATVPPTSNLNLSRIDNTAAVFAVVKLAGTTTKTITIRNNAGTVDVLVDKLGYFGTGSETGRFTTPTNQRRVLDTRGATGGHHSPLGNGVNGAVVATGVPAGATAAIVDLTAVTPSHHGYLAAAAGCSTSVSSLNYLRYTRANLSIVPLTDAGTFCLESVGDAVDAVVDVVGYVSTTGSEFYALPSAQRIIDTRNGNGGAGRGAATRPFPAKASTAFYGSNVGVVPADATALFTGAVEASNTAGGFLTFFPGGTTPASLTSNLTFSAGRSVANAAVVGLSGRTFGVYNGAGSTQAAVDVSGYFAPSAAEQ